MDFDDAYANASYIPNGLGYLDIWADKAEEFRALEASIGRARLNQPYGDAPREGFDLFHPAGPAKGVIVFVHGGFWRMLSRQAFSHLAAGARDSGWQMALPSYTLTPEASIADITRQIATSVDAIAAITRGPIVLCGHSAGGHLVARMVMGDAGLSAATAARIERVVPISPLSDLRPLIHTAMNDDFKLDEAAAVSESPALHPKTHSAKVHVWVGGDERPAFLDQAKGLGDAWDVPVTLEPNRHHFDVIEGLEDATSPLMRLLAGAGDQA